MKIIELEKKIAELENTISTSLKSCKIHNSISLAGSRRALNSTPIKISSDKPFNPLPKELDLSAIQAATIGVDEDCGYCDSPEDFLIVENYLKDMKNCGGICLGCLDFFYDQPWFPLVHPNMLNDDDPRK